MQLFLTDYASYNNGTQFEFGHWVDLTNFSDADEFMTYCTNHLAEADEKSPIFGTTREEIMFTDFEGFPKIFYSESPSMPDLEKIYLMIEHDLIDKEVEDLPYHVYLSENNLEPIEHNDEDFFNMFYEGKPEEAVRATFYGDYRYMDEFVTFNGYGNLESFNNISDHLDKDEVLLWLLENPEHL